MGLKDDITLLYAKRDEVTALEDRVFNAIRRTVMLESSKLNSNLPEGYYISAVSEVEASDPERVPSVYLIIAKANGKVADSEESSRLGELLKQEYKRIEEMYGFSIVGP
jgi:hypothetical protein